MEPAELERGVGPFGGLGRRQNQIAARKRARERPLDQEIEIILQLKLDGVPELGKSNGLFSSW
jgi:hypothetical protein